MAAAAAFDACGRNTHPERQFSRLERLQEQPGIKRLFQNQLRRLRRHFLDLHAARFRGHEYVLAHGAIENNAQVKLAFDRQSLFDQQTLHHSALRAGLMSDQSHAQHLFGNFGRFGGILGDLYAAALASAARMNLRLHNHAAADLLGRRFGLFHRVRHFSSRDRHAVFGEDRLRLILVNFHSLDRRSH